jgi:hypothetical protein
MKKAVPIFSLLFVAATVLPAQQLLSEAVAAFPAQTVSLEYDALSKLRTLPSYASMRKQYSGEGLQRAQRDLLLLGISENQLSEVVTGSGPNGFFGLLAGSFHQTAAMKDAVKHGMIPSVLDDGPVFCAKDAVCFLLPSQEDGHALFGNLDQLRAISDVRQGRAASLRSNTTFMNLLNRMEPESPVFGFAPGKEIGDWIGTSIPAAISSHIDLNRLFSTIENFGYSVKVDSKAHVGLNLFCSSEEAGTVLKDTLSAASGLERAAAMAAGSSAMPFDKMVVQSSGRIVAVNLDAAIQ